MEIKVSKRGGFSDRNNIKPENKIIQLKDFDERTRIQLQNMLNELYLKVYHNDINDWNQSIQDFFRYVLGTIYSQSYDVSKHIRYDYIKKIIDHTLSRDEYDDVLTVIEAIIQYWDKYLKDVDDEYFNYFLNEYVSKSLFEVVNNCFEKEYVGYRFIDDIISPVSDEFEVGAILDALNNSEKVVREHLSKANKLIADRDNPDYENSIKESISAVEAICEILTDTNGKDATLGRMIKKLEESGIMIHSGLKQAFNILYGYTSDANGVRHAGDIGGPSSTFEEAKFMLVACSAFINYLWALSAD
jgi:hypothetical protein